MSGTAAVADAILAGALLIIGLLERRKHRRHGSAGQALAESAIMLAVLLPLALAATQVALLLAYHVTQENATVTLAAVAAQDGPGAAFDAAVAVEAARIDCEAPVVVLESPTPDVTVVTLRCTWRAPVYLEASWPVTTSASAAVPAGAVLDASATPEPSGSVAP